MKRLLSSVALVLGLVASVATADVCFNRFGAFTSASTFNHIPLPNGNPSGFVLMDVIVDDGTCSEALADLLLFGPANYLISFDACGQTHYYAPDVGSLWIDVVDNCRVLGYANL